MRTDEAAQILGYVKSYITELIRNGKLKGTKIGQRFWDVDPKSVEEYRSLTEGTQAKPQPETGSQLGGKPTQLVEQEYSKSSTVNGVNVPDLEIINMVQEFEKISYFIDGTYINIAQMFWMLNQFFMDGIEPASIFPTLLQVVPVNDPDKKAKAANETLRMLMFELRTLGLVHDIQRRYRTKAYMVVVATKLGLKVLRVLESRGWPRI
jgi:excisionase family DNA binding protein